MAHSTPTPQPAPVSWFGCHHRRSPRKSQNLKDEHCCRLLLLLSSKGSNYRVLHTLPFFESGLKDQLPFWEESRGEGPRMGYKDLSLSFHKPWMRNRAALCPKKFSVLSMSLWNRRQGSSSSTCGPGRAISCNGKRSFPLFFPSTIPRWIPAF